MSSLESRGYVATEDDIRALSGSILDALNTAGASRLSYLRALIGTTQHNLGAPSRQRPAKGQKLKEEEVKAAQLAALEAVHAKFYAIVDATTREKLGSSGLTKKGKGGLAEEVNRRVNYARTAMSAIRGWIRAGNDVNTLVAAKVTKASLMLENRPRRRPSTSRLATRAGNQTKQLLTTVKALASVDKDAAIAELDTLMKKLVAHLVELKGPATRDARQAAAEGMPLRIGKNTFIPTARP